ncbi:MAG: glycosyltransferase [bacterium]
MYNINSSKENNKKRILHIVEALGGGVLTYIIDLTNQLCDEFDQYIAYAIRPQTPNRFMDNFDSSIKFIKVENFTRAISPFKDLKAFFEMKNIEREINPDIIHLHSTKAGIIGRWAFNDNETPTFYTPHGYSFLMKDHGYLKRTVYKAIEMISSKRNCTTISCSPGEHQETLKLSNQAELINNGINISKLQIMMDKFNFEEKHPYTVFTLGRICYQKNPEQFNDIAKKLSDIRFIWIGDGDLKHKLTSNNIKITGWVDRETAIMHALNSDVFLLTSLWEGLPISLLEAMYMKKICVVSNVIGNRDVIKNGENGFVCNETDEFVEAIIKAKEIIRNKRISRESKIIKKAYSDIMRKYNVEVMGREYKNIYLKVL